MEAEDTVLVLGAGASKPYGLPTGAELVHEICTRFVDMARSLGDREPIREAYAREVGEFVGRLEESDPPNIDAFLQRNPGLEKYGKLAISLLILDREDPAKLLPRDPGGERQQHWYGYLWQRIDPGEPRHLYHACPRIITFNYDRSLEEYLFRRVMKMYDLSEETTAQYVKLVPIAHVHGSVGRLAWQDGSDKPVHYGSSGSVMTRADVMTAAERLRIVGGLDVSGSPVTLARQWLSEARVVGFLGFGYLKENMQILFRGLSPRANLVITGSAYGLTEARREEIAIHLSRMLRHDDVRPDRSANGAWILRQSLDRMVEMWFGDKDHGNLEFLEHSAHLLRW